MYYCCQFSDPSLSKIAVLSVKAEISYLEVGLSTEGYFEISQARKLSDALKRAHEAFPDCHILVRRNEKAFIDRQFLANLKTVIEAYTGPWSMVGGGGLGVNSETYVAHYAAEIPSLSYNPERRVILDVLPDIYLLNGEALAAYLADGCDLQDLFEPWFIHSGMKKGRLAFYDHRLACPINGRYMCRDFPSLLAEFDQVSAQFQYDQLPTLSGTLVAKTEGVRRDDDGKLVTVAREDIRNFTQTAMASIAEPVSISVVVRTIFKRTYLLHRLLASIVRALVDGVSVEVVLSTDIDADDAAEAFEITKGRFGNLNLKLNHSSPADTPEMASRVRNLIEGAKAAAGEYLWFMDDDDFIDPFSFANLATQLYDGVRPIFFVSSEIRDELWQEGAAGRAVLSHSERRGVWGADGWRSLFMGVNRVPVCGIVAPRTCIVAAFDSIPMRYNLSEDYVMHLAILLGGNLPLIVELNQVFSYISMRGVNENTMNVSDRTNWCLDIFGFLQDLRFTNSALDKSVLRLGTRTLFDDTYLKSENESLKKAVAEAQEKNKVLTRQIAFVTQLIAEQETK